ncbi:hypothetical protein F0562_025906 [Nyssa sinensis]|uniref:Uncharacterized protein n=1 Tax=Nyssa sinensis TaxID=561372 RepID=A0A5J5B9B1_9ASTE|nr:hypothetical protein F0562_025906 [Nyssa sinensis]
MAAYYLNLAYHYEADVRVKDSLLGSLRVVISRLETNPNRASQALAEVKIFREAMYGFVEQAAIRGRTRTDPGVDFKPIDLATVFAEDEEGVGISEWLDDPGDALLDELDDDGQPNRPNTFLATWANHYLDDDMGKPSQPRNRAQNRNTPHGVDAIIRGMDLINSGLSSMSMSESEHDRRGGSSSSYGYGSRYDQPYGYDPRGHNLHTHSYGSSTYGYGSGYDSQTSSSHGYGPAPAPAQREGWIPTPTSQQLGCSVTEYERFRAEYEAWYHNYMNWADYCRHIHNTHNIPLDEYSELGPTYAPARHSTADWM